MPDQIPATMRALLLDRPGSPLRLAELPCPRPGPGQLLLRVEACGVCRTDLHVLDGDLPAPKQPVIPGHEIVGRVVRQGPGAHRYAPGTRLGVPWLGHTCGTCPFCRTARENLCDAPGFTGYTLDGGYADYVVAEQAYCFPLSEALDPPHAAPLLCAGLIGHRALKLAGPARRLGLYGFGAAAHIVAQVARYEGREIHAFVRPGDEAAAAFARSLGCIWAGPSDALPPEPLQAAILFAPVGALVPAALAAVEKGGRVVAAGIHMSDIPAFPYALLWGEREIRSVANLTRRDGEEFLALAPAVPVQTTVERFPLERGNEALARLRSGTLTGAAVLVP